MLRGYVRHDLCVDLCGYMRRDVRRQIYLWGHMRAYVLRGYVQCDLCGRNLRVNLRVDMRVDMLRGYVRHDLCVDLCGYMRRDVRRQSYLWGHMRAHVLRGYVQCDLCGRNLRVNLRVHMLRGYVRHDLCVDMLWSDMRFYLCIDLLRCDVCVNLRVYMFRRDLHAGLRGSNRSCTYVVTDVLRAPHMQRWHKLRWVRGRRRPAHGGRYMLCVPTSVYLRSNLR